MLTQCDFAAESREVDQTLFPKGRICRSRRIDACREFQKREAARPVILAFIDEDSPEFSEELHTRGALALKNTHASLWTLTLQARIADLPSEGNRERLLLVNDDARDNGGMNTTVLSKMGLEGAFGRVADTITTRYDIAYARPETMIPPTKLEVTTRKAGATVRATRWADNDRARHAPRFSGIAALAAAAGLAALAAAPLAARQVFRAGTDMVLLSVSAADAANHPVAGLEQKDFVVFEDGIAQEISFFAREAQPIALSLLIDTSTSMEPRMAIAQEAAIGFTKRLTKSDVEQVIDFNSDYVVRQTFTNDLDALEKAIRQTRAGGSTSLYNALYAAFHELNQVRATSTEDVRRQAIVVLSDGEDTTSLIS